MNPAYTNAQDLDLPTDAVIPPNQSQLQIPSESHFFVRANVSIEQYSAKDIVLLRFEDGHAIQARIGTRAIEKWRKLHPDHPDQEQVNFQGAWQVTLLGGTALGGIELASCGLNNIFPLEEADDLNGRSTFWSALGTVIRMDRVHGLAIIRVYPQTKAREPYAVAALISLELLKTVEDFYAVQMSGVVRNGVLVAEQIQKVHLTIPTVWQFWKPAYKRKRLVEDPKDQELDINYLLGRLVELTRAENKDHPFAMRIKSVVCSIPLQIGQKARALISGAELDRLFDGGFFTKALEDNTINAREVRHCIQGYIGVMQLSLETMRGYDLSESILRLEFFRKGQKIYLTGPLHGDLTSRLVYGLDVEFERV
jgi:hypothetical protein